MNITRRELLRLIGAACAPVSLISASQASGQRLTLVHTSDTHLCDLSGFHPEFVEMRKRFAQGVTALKAFFHSVPGKTGAHAVVITGDLIDHYEGPALDGSVKAGQLELFAKQVEISPVPLWLTLGNRDLSSFWFDAEGEFQRGQHNAHRARAAWTRHVPCFREGTYYNHVRRVGGTVFRLIFLDNGYQVRVGDPPEVLDRAQLEWLGRELQMAKDEVVILFMHIPLRADTSAPRESLMQLLSTRPAVRAIIAGHRHQNHAEEIAFPEGHKIAQVLTGTLQVDPANWRTIHLSEQSIRISTPGGAETEVELSVG